MIERENYSKIREGKKTESKTKENIARKTRKDSFPVVAAVCTPSETAEPDQAR